MSEARLEEQARAIFQYALEDCSVERALERKLCVAEDGAVVFDGDDLLDLTAVRHLRVVAVGKASAAMLTGVLSRLVLPIDCEVAGVLIAPARPDVLPRGIAFFAGGHPLPNQASFDGAAAALKMLQEVSSIKDAFCVYLISGGASAMMELPLDRNISVDEMRAFYRALVHSGATIAEINCIRKHISAVKGGRLAMAAGILPSLTMLVSDVPPECLDALGSGPTLPDSSTVAECLALLQSKGLIDVLPQSVRNFFSSSALVETPKAGRTKPRVWKLLDSDDLGDAALRQAVSLAYHVVIDNTCDDWSYADAAVYLLERVRALRTQHPRVCLISTGEVTVAVADKVGDAPRRGGRNQHFALHLATLLTASDGPMAVLSAGSDGIDGNSHATGAVVWPGLVHDGNIHKARAALNNFDATSFFEAHEGLVVSGATGNNLRDLRIFLAVPPNLPAIS